MSQTTCSWPIRSAWVIASLALLSPVRAEDAKEKENPAERKAKIDAKAKVLRQLWQQRNQVGVVVEVDAVGGAAPAQPDEKQVNDALVQQFSQQFQPFLINELAFVRLVCGEIPVETRTIIRTKGEESLKNAATEYAQLQQGQMRGRIVRKAEDWPHPPNIIRAGLKEAVKEHLSTEQFENYIEQIEKRKEARKRAAILCVVARLDDALRLTVEQRDKIADAIAKNWNDGWEQWLMIEQYGNQYMPQIPDEILSPLITSEQKSIWDAWQKINFGYWYQPRTRPPIDDNWWGFAENEPAKPNNAVPVPAVRLGPLPAILRLFAR